MITTIIASAIVLTVTATLLAVATVASWLV